MKKASFEIWQTTLMFEVVISILVASILFYSAVNLSDTSMVNENYMNKDIFNLAGLVGSYGGDFEVKYNAKNYAYDGEVVEEEGCELEIIKKGDEIAYEC